MLSRSEVNKQQEQKKTLTINSNQNYFEQLPRYIQELILNKLDENTLMETRCVSKNFKDKADKKICKDQNLNFFSKNILNSDRTYYALAADFKLLDKNELESHFLKNPIDTCKNRLLEFTFNNEKIFLFNSIDAITSYTSLKNPVPKKVISWHLMNYVPLFKIKISDPNQIKNLKIERMTVNDNNILYIPIDSKFCQIMEVSTFFENAKNLYKRTEVSVTNEQITEYRNKHSCNIF